MVSKGVVVVLMGESKGIFDLAERKIGALVVIEMRDRVSEFLEEGQALESEPSPELLMSIFQKKSPLHDGAVLIQDGRVSRVACYLLLTSSKGLPKQWGTRHRSAFGLSEKSDALVVVVSEEIAAKLSGPKVHVAGIGQATDTHAVHDREDPTDLKAVRLASEKAFAMAGLAPSDVDVAELHDAFTILEIAESEAAGFFPRGEGHLALERGETALDGKLPINPSGGLKAKGHPVGATGVAHLVELTWQLRGEAEERQIKDAKTGYACNFGGFGNNVVATVLRREAT